MSVYVVVYRRMNFYISIFYELLEENKLYDRALRDNYDLFILS